MPMCSGPPGRRHLSRLDEYRYVSPTFGYDEQGMVRELINAALTNMPVLDGMRPVAAASLMFFDNGEKPMNEKPAPCALCHLWSWRQRR
ncbi:Mu-like prophage I protein [Cedecea neteri]|uniref:Mu-like prophage I protein n=1 Tax=Cedecea neteri TaxID=158822 RepID=A0A2X3IMB0_9ENTR|nr:Mu-like prophage I protein [Cedecea neteri]